MAKVRLLKYTPVLFLMLVDALYNTLDDKGSTPKCIFSTPVGIYSTLCEAPDLHDRIWGPLHAKCSTPK